MEKKKFRLNFIDLVFVLLIAALAFTAYYLSHRNSNETQQVQQRSYVIELTDLAPNMADVVQIGDPVTDTVRNYSLGTVTNVEIAPCTQRVLDEDADIYRLVEIPDKITLLITVEADTVESEKEIATVSGYALRVGTFVNCTAGKLLGSGYILELDR